MSRHRIRILACALAPMLVAAIVAYAHGTYVDSDAEVQTIGPASLYPYYTEIHTRHDWTISAVAHPVDAISRYYCFVSGEETQSSPLIYNNNLGPGYVDGGGTMWTFWLLANGSHATKASTYLSADYQWVLAESNWVLFDVDWAW